MTSAWGDVFISLKERTQKPRATGITMVLDKCQGSNAVADHMHLFSQHVDHWKLSFGTTALLSETILLEKITSLSAHDTIVYPGGTLAEVAVVRGVWRPFLLRACELGFRGIEISDGTIQLPRDVRDEMIRFGRGLGLSMITEVGKKDREQQPTPEHLAEQALADFETGADWVIVEARESGRGIGVFGDEGTVNEADVDTLNTLLSDHMDRVIWETPLKKQQEYFILRFGPNVCLGNIAPRDVLGVEAMRNGLRFETFQHEVEKMERM